MNQTFLLMMLAMSFTSRILLAADIGVKTGVCIGSLSKTTTVAGEQTKIEGSFGGFPLAIAYYLDLNPKFTMEAQGEVMFDLLNNQIVRQGFDLSLGYHIMGGSREVSMVPDVVYGRASSGLSVVGRGGLHNYSAVSKQDSSTKISGGVFEIMGGFQYRREFSKSSDIGGELMMSLFSVPASTEQIKPQLIQLVGIWRFFI